jgi:hypothetical protein
MPSRPATPGRNLDPSREPTDMSADKDRAIRRQKQKRAKALKKAERRAGKPAPARPAPASAG